MKRHLAICAVASSVLLLLSACSGAQLANIDEFGIFGTQARWVYVPVDAQREAQIGEEIGQIAHEIDASLAVSSEESFIARFNAADAGETVEIDAVTYQALLAAKSVYVEASGAYNPATGLLVDLWGFSPRHMAVDYVPTMPYDRAEPELQMPDETYLALFSDAALNDFGAVEVYAENGRFYATKPEHAYVEADGVRYTMQLNLGGIGKGYCVDEVRAHLLSQGQTQGYYTLGGSSMALFSDPMTDDGVWEVSLNAPREQFGESYAALRVRDTALSVSGDDEQFYMIDGVRYSHIIDPETGIPVGEGSHVVCATIVGGSAAEGDARATAIVTMELSEALDYARSHVDAFGTVFLWYDAVADAYTVYSNAGDALLMHAEGLSVEVIA